MKYHMHKKEREITDNQNIEFIIQDGKLVIISMCKGNEPYVVTMNYGYDTQKHALYFHCAKKGLKLDIIRINPEVCATVVQDRGYIMDKCSHAYTSAVFWGKLYIVQDMAEKKYGINILIDHLEDNPNQVKKRLLKNNAIFNSMEILRLDIQTISGKEGN